MKWLKGLPKPVGIMACNDDRAQHITAACINAKIDVPYEVAVIGVDNDEQVCDISNPPVSSVALDVEKAGFRVSELLDKMMAGKKLPPQTVFVRPIKVVTRQSTDIVAVEDKLVAQALIFCGALFLVGLGFFAWAILFRRQRRRHLHHSPNPASKHRRSITGPNTSGITSPALRMMTTSPIITPLRRTSS